MNMFEGERKMSTTLSVVQIASSHKPSLKERVNVKVTVNYIGKKEPSSQAVDKFIEVYLEIIKRIEQKNTA